MEENHLRKIGLTLAYFSPGLPKPTTNFTFLKPPKSDSELTTELEALLKAHFSLRMQLSMQQLNKNSEIRKVKRDIARIRTILREKKVA